MRTLVLGWFCSFVAVALVLGITTQGIERREQEEKVKLLQEMGHDVSKYIEKHIEFIRGMKEQYEQD